MWVLRFLTKGFQLFTAVSALIYLLHLSETSTQHVLSKKNSGSCAILFSALFYTHVEKKNEARQQPTHSFRDITLVVA